MDIEIKDISKLLKRYLEKIKMFDKKFHHVISCFNKYLLLKKFRGLKILLNNFNNILKKFLFIHS